MALSGKPPFWGSQGSLEKNSLGNQCGGVKFEFLFLDDGLGLVCVCVCFFLFVTSTREDDPGANMFLESCFYIVSPLYLVKMIHVNLFDKCVWTG